MNITDHLATLLSIVVGLGLTEMFGNLHRLIRTRTRVTWDWLPVAWAAIISIWSAPIPADFNADSIALAAPSPCGCGCVR